MLAFKKYLLNIFVVGSFIALISNALVFRAYILQQKSVVDLNNIVPKMTEQEAIYHDLIYPNINIYTVPFKTNLGRVYLRDSQYNKAINSLQLAREKNPFLLINDNYLAQTYLTIGERDSFKFYANKIFNKGPNHPNHFAFYVKSLENLTSSKKIDSAFSQITYKSKPFWRIYLSSIYSTKMLTEQAKKNVKLADSLFPLDKEIQDFLAVLKYGKENFEKFEEYNAVADQFAKGGDFDQSKIILLKALRFNPDNNLIYDKLSTLYYKQKKFDSSMYFLNKIKLNKFVDKGRYYLLRGINLINLDNKEEGCNEIYEAILLGNREAIKANKSFCN